MDISARKAELDSFSWQRLRDLCADYGIEKEETDSWADCIPQILEHEELEALSAPVIVQTPETTKTSKEVTLKTEPTNPPLNTYATEFYRKIGLWVCSECGEKRRSGMNGQRICPASKKDCKHI